MNAESTGAAETIISAGTIQGENIAMGDFHQTIHTKGRDRLARIHFDRNDQEYLPPDFSDELLRQLAEKRIVLISENDMVTGTDLARHIGARLLQQSAFTDMTAHELVRESEENQESRSLVTEVLKYENCHEKVILLYDVHPQMIDYKFDKLITQAREADCLFIITACCGADTWAKAGRATGDYWFEIPHGRHYPEELLRSYFISRMRRSAPTFLENSIDEEDFLLSHGIYASAAAAELVSPEQVKLFTGNYAGLASFPSDHRVRDLIAMAGGGPEQMVRAWFYQLSHRNKILAITAAIFDGVPVDQYLEALRTLTDTTFLETSDPSLKAVDYFDLSFLDLFFQTQMRGEERYLTSKSRHSKKVLIDTGRNEYRRHFKAALHAFMAITKQTYERGATNWELYGTSGKRVSLRQSFTETLSLTATVEFGLAENHLLNLASTGRYFQQNICAKAIAQWRANGSEELFFRTLRTWRRDEAISERMNTLFARNVHQAESRGEESVDLIQATIVLALRHAAYLDKPNQLHEEIAEAMTEFATGSADKDNLRNNIVMALPEFIRDHTLQLENELYNKLMPVYYLREPIIKGLRNAMEQRPEEVCAALKRWLTACLGDASKLNRRGAPTQRDNRLIIVLEALAEVNLDNSPIFNREMIYTDFLIPLVQQENRPEVVRYVLALLAAVQAEDLALAAQYASQTIGKLDRNQRLALIYNWGRIYREQRLATEGTDTYTYDEEAYPMWTQTAKRPLTPIETTLYQWMERDDLLRRFATLVFLELARGYDRHERSNIYERELRLQRQQTIMHTQPYMQPTRPIALVQQEIQLHLWLRIRIFLYFLFSSNQHKYLLKDTMLLLLNTNRYSAADREILLQRWQRNEHKGITGNLAGWLRKFF
jgi:hypothetical protein